MGFHTQLKKALARSTALSSLPFAIGGDNWISFETWRAVHDMVMLRSVDMGAAQ